MEKHYHYTYRINFKGIPHVYFGVRTSRCHPSEDIRYLGSPERHKDYWALYEPVKTVLATYKTREEAGVAETELILQQWTKNKKVSLNACISAVKFNSCGYSPSQKTREAIGKANRGRPATQKQRDACRLNIVKAHQDPKTKEACIAAIQKPFYIVSPDGEVFEGINLKLFCKTKNLAQGNCVCVIKGENFHANGWTASLDAHKLFIEYYKSRGFSWYENYKRWLVQWYENGNRYKKDFRLKVEALEYRDILALRGIKWKVCPRDWKARLEAMQSESA